MDGYVVGAFVVYLLAMLLIGFYFTNKTTSLGEYYLGDRKMNKWVVALSAQASDMSGWLLMGLPGAIYLSGLSEAWIGVGLAVGTYLNWKIVAERLRKYSHRCGDAITIPDFFSNRFRDKSGVVRTISALITLVFFLFYTASGFVACAKLFSTTFGMRYDYALLLGVFVLVSYTLMGGFNAVCWTDVVQGTIMFFAIVAVPLMCIVKGGGIESSLQSLQSLNGDLLSLFTSASTGSSLTAIGLVSCLAWGLGYFGMPHILVRFMAIDDAKNISGSRHIAMVWVVVSLSAAILSGLLGHIYVSHSGLIVDDPEKIFMYMIKGLFHPLLIGVLLSAILAAIMSTADSQLLVSASAFSNDFYKTVLRPRASNRELMAVSRISVAAVAIIAGFIALRPESDFVKAVMKLVSFSWGGFGAAFGPVMLLSLFWRRINLAGAVSGMLVGAGTTFVWKFFLSSLADRWSIFGLYELAPGFLLSLLTILTVSLLTPPPSEEITNEFDAVAAK